ncbi:ribonuclease H family protein [Tissierella carlieri]|jgi:viroplasmin and RNaseH domain-containing protein|uniref:ribonuclease H1 domain-containing protein n=1 Tax=Tissierella carlieri TaxID=689904 RepID=UPI001C104598|nr:ribonuclease H family protein [Tissierella carlieri]MBU5311433.1 ribonuclease H family protein [Tissierella carlieri]
MGKFYYAVRKGKTPGIYETWGKCEEQVKGYSGAEYKKFSTYEEALSFIDGGNEEIKLLDKSQLKENEAIAYVDGSFDIRNSTYSYGVVFITLDGKETYSGREDNEELAEMRNVSGEIKGAMVAMDLAIEKGKDTLYLHFDYTGIEQWAKGSWKTNKDGTRFYKEFYDSIKDKLNVVFIKVKAHSGIEYNEEADKLAKEAIII